MSCSYVRCNRAAQLSQGPGGSRVIDTHSLVTLGGFPTRGKEEYHPHPPPLQVRAVLLKILLLHDMLLWTTDELLNSHKLQLFQCTLFLDGVQFRSSYWAFVANIASKMIRTAASQDGFRRRHTLVRSEGDRNEGVSVEFERL
jgi:hypothetical protein